MTDVVHSVNLDQRLDFPHDQYFPNNTPATIATTTPIQASFGGFDLTGELTQSTCVNNFFEIPNWTLIAAMSFQLSDQEININNSPQSNVSPSQQQNSRQYNDMTATAFSNQFSHDNSVQQTSILPSPPFVEPSGNYIAISSASNTTQTLPYGYPSSTLPTSNTQSINLENGNHIGNNFSSINSRNSYINNSTQQQHHQQQQHQQQHHQQQPSHQPQQSHHQSRIEITNQLIPGYNYQCLNQRDIYQTSIPSSIGNNSHHHGGNHQKQISRSINTFSRQDNTINLPISIAPNLFMQQFNNQTNNASPMLLPLFDPSTTIFTTKPTTNPNPVPTTISISQNSTTTSESTSPTKQTYSYSGPPKSYYSRLPLYDRPFKCDQCPQSFNRNHDLKRHKRIHLAVKPYPCQYCEKQFSRKDALKRHVLVKGCNNTSNNNKKSTSSNNGNNNNNNNKNVVESSNTSISTTSIENYVDNGDQIKTEPANDNGFGMTSI